MTPVDVRVALALAAALLLCAVHVLTNARRATQEILDLLQRLLGQDRSMLFGFYHAGVVIGALAGLLVAVQVLVQCSLTVLWQ